ncbi:CAP domain-containing protein [Marinibacterium sp. SX1]|uniref:CAP domain-containing protein n=1 Tax=Marinibacterium sp. SX1 TaxID=3388424 RepID=UPI003D167B85
MLRLFSLLLAGMLVLAACTAPEYDNGSTGSSPTKVYRIRSGETSKIQFRMLDSVNSLRSASGAGPVQLNAQLNAAAATHSRDMSVQNRPWHFGSDGSSPIDRTARAGYTGRFLGENISETYETEIETLGAWMDQPGTRDVILDPTAVNMGFAWYQEKSGKIWWTMILGG